MRTYYVRFAFVNGSYDCSKEKYIKYIVENDDIPQIAIDKRFQEWFEEEVHSYLEAYGYVVPCEDLQWETEEDKIKYYQERYCSWNYITKEEYYGSNEEEEEEI